MKRRRPKNVFAEDDLVELFADEPELLAIADAYVVTQNQRRVRHRKRLLAMSLAVFLTFLVAVPALALTGVVSVREWFTQKAAPTATIKRFDELRLEAPPRYLPNVISGQARVVDTLPLGSGENLNFVVAPTRQGGYCFELGRLALGCNAQRKIRFIAGVTIPNRAGGGIAYGSLLGTNVGTVTISRRDGRQRETRALRVSAPIDASFFMIELPNVRAALPLTITVEDLNGDTLASKRITPPPTGLPGG